MGVVRFVRDGLRGGLVWGCPMTAPFLSSSTLPGNGPGPGGGGIVPPEET